MVRTMSEMSGMKVAVLSGGKSMEREISLASGASAVEGLERAGLDVMQLDPADKGDVRTLVTEPFDAAFLCVHGKFGEDGCIQGLLELLEMPYTGSGVMASALAMDKQRAKEVYAHAGIATPEWVEVHRGETYDVDEIASAVGEKSVVKAVSGGSTIGIFLVDGREELGVAIDEAFEYDEKVIIERYVAGDEYTVAVIGGHDIEALPVIRIIPAKGFYDFEAKYSDGGSKHVCPAPIDEPLKEALQFSALAAHRALGCWGVSRTDFIVDAEGRHWALETNTLPGLTKTSLLPDAARVAGISFEELCAKLVSCALERQEAVSGK